MRNLITNNCLGAFWHKQNADVPFPTPFSWTRLDAVSMSALIKYMYTINWMNFTLKPNIDLEMYDDDKKNGQFSVIVENKVTIQYNHIKFNPHYQESVVQGIDVFYVRPYELVLKTYIKRTKRMIESGLASSFVYMDDYRGIDTLETIRAMISDAFKYKVPLTIFTMNLDLSSPDPNLISIITPNEGLCACEFGHIMSVFGNELIRLQNIT